jgi:hypothetical protein
MGCFNGLSPEQQHRLINVGNLPIGYRLEGKCQSGAEVEVTTQWDTMPGPRFYCVPCAIEYLVQVFDDQLHGHMDTSDTHHRRSE